MTPPAEGASTGSRRGWSRRQQVNVVVWALAAAAAIGGALAGCHPTGTPVVDPVFAAVIAGLLTLAMSRARRIPTIVVAAGALAFARGWVFLPAGLAVAVALVTTFARRRHQCLGALVGALAAQAVLRWPAVGFHGSTALAAAGVLAVAFLSAYRQLGRRARRRSRWAVAGLAVAAVVLTVPAVLGALAARSAASAAIAEARSSLHAVGSAPTAEAESQLRAATADLHSAHGQAGSWYTAGARLVPVVAQNRQALAVATGAAERLTSAAATEVTTVDLHNLGYHDGRVDLGRLAAFRTPVATLATQSTDAQAALRSIRSPWLVPPIGDRLRSLSGELDKATGSIHLANDAVADLPGILGGNGVRHYLVILETPAEQRGLDGLLGDYAELTVDNGHIALTDAASFSKVNEALPPGGAKLTGLADYLARYGKFNPGENFEDVTYAPDLPTVGKVIQQMYSQAGGDHLDGVLALDTSGIAALLKLTGPITVPGTTTTLTADTAADYLNRTEYIQFASAESTTRHDVLQQVLQTAFNRLTETALPGPATLGADLGPAVRGGRIMFWSDHPADTPLVDDAHITGAFPRPAPGTDVLAVTTQNADNNKIDAYLSRTLTDRVSIDPPSGRVVETLTIRLHNAAPPAGLPPYVIGSYPNSGIPTSDNRTWLTLYTPLLLSHASRDGAPVHLQADGEFGVHAYSAYVDVPTDDTVTMSLELRGRVGAGATYTISYRDQPTAIASSQSIEVAPVGGWRVAGPATWQPAPGSTGRRTFHFAAP